MTNRRWLWVLLGVLVLGLASLLAAGVLLFLWVPTLIFADSPVPLGVGAGDDPTPIREALVESLRETGEVRITARQLNAVFPQSEETRCAMDLLENKMEIRCSVMIDDEGEPEPRWVSTSWRGRLEVHEGRCAVLENDRVTVGRIPVTWFFRDFDVTVCQEIWSNPENADFSSKVDAFYVEDSVLMIRVSEAGRAEIRGPQDAPAASPPPESGSD